MPRGSGVEEWSTVTKKNLHALGRTHCGLVTSAVTEIAFTIKVMRAARPLAKMQQETAPRPHGRLTKPTDLSCEPAKGRNSNGMAKIAQKPIFCVVLGNGQQWAVEAEWPDGTIEQIDTFKAHFEAVNWLNDQSEEWLQERRGRFQWRDM